MSKRDDAEAKGEKDIDEASEDEAREATKAKAAEAKVDDDDDDDDDDEEEEEEAAAAPTRRQPARRSAGSAKAQSAKRSAPSTPAASSSVAMPRVALFLIAALGAGGAVGWFGHEAQAKARIQAESAAAPAGSGVPAGACGAWQQKICAGGGDTSAVCAQAKGAVELLTTSSCEAGLAAMPATLAKMKAARASCDSLVSKLCKDLPPGSQACALVKDKTPAFPTQRCDEMLKHYDEVLGSLRQMDDQGGPGGPGGPGMGRPQMGSPGMGHPPMTPPPGH